MALRDATASGSHLVLIPEIWIDKLYVPSSHFFGTDLLSLSSGAIASTSVQTDPQRINVGLLSFAFTVSSGMQPDYDNNHFKDHDNARGRR